MSRPTREIYLASAMEILNGVTVYKANGEMETRRAPAHDVEEFISGSRKRVYDPDGFFLGYAIPEHFLSDWMTGHVRVPVELIEFIEAKEHHLPIEDRHALNVMLNESKDPS